MNGLTTVEVKKNQEIYGFNKLKEVKKPNFIIVFINEFKDWLVIILIIAAFLSIIVDPHSLIESLIIFAILIINALIGAFLEINASNTLESLKKVSEHNSKVIRDGEIKLVLSSELTINDIVLLEKGDVIDADMKLIEAIDFKVDESSLTGESIPVSKNIGDEIYSMTYIISGYAKAIVTKIGMKTKIGIIADTIIKHKNDLTPSIPTHQKYKIYIAPQAQLHLDDHNPISITDIRLLRRLVRDMKFRNSKAEETLSMWPSVRRGEFRWIYDNQEGVNFVFNSELTYELCVLKKYALPMLSEIPSDSEYYIQANKLIKFLKYFKDIEDDWIPCNSILREFIGGSSFYRK